MPTTYTSAQKEQAKADFLVGCGPEEIALKIGCSSRTIRNWAKKEEWQKNLKHRFQTISNLEAQIAELSNKKITNNTSQQITALTDSLVRLKKITPTPKSKLKPTVKGAISRELLTQMLSPEYGLYPYQRDFLQDDSRFIKVLKARQIGYSYGCLAPKALLRAMAGRNQLIVSASEYQSRIVLNYVKQHLEKLEIEPDEIGEKSITIRGSQIVALPTNFRTIQGNPGDVILDEFAWYHRQKRIWEAIVPSITQVGGTITVCSTPFVPGNFFWEIITEHKGKFSNFASYKLTIYDAIEQGMPLPGGVEELRSLFDSDSWHMLYECEWAEDGSALLSWDLLHSLANVTEMRFWDEPIYSGVDVGRTNDRFAIANVGTVIGTVEPKKYRLLHLDLEKNLSFALQRQKAEEVFKRYIVKRMNIDRTGLGMQLAEEIVNAHPNVAVGKHFSRGLKERLALNLLKLCEDKCMVLINDSFILAQLHALKKKATSTGITYDAERDETGHADGFWALALAVEGLSRGDEGRVIVEIL